MLHIKILGPSCANCLKLEIIVLDVLKEMGVRNATFEKVATEKEIQHHLTGDPPGLVVNNQLVWSGGNTLPTKVQIADWIREVVVAHPD